MLHEILIEYSFEDLRELAQSRGIDTDHKTRGELINKDAINSIDPKLIPFFAISF